MMEKLLISACLLGVASRYDGKSIKKVSDEALLLISEKYQLVPFCPEIYGGLPTPRNPSEKIVNEVFMNNGTCVTENYRKGAEEALRICRLLGISKALLKAKSPACGKGLIYDGSFSGTLTEGHGICAELLLSEGIEVFTENEIEKLI